MTVVTQKNFSGGIMSPMMLGRSDDTKYQSGLKECQNFICLPTGAIQNRAGFEYVRECKYADKPVRLVRFTFSRDQTMVLEFGHKYVRFHTQGATLLNDNGTPYEIASQYSSDDVMELQFVQSADIMAIVHHNYPPTELRRYSVRDWRFNTIKFNNALSAPTGVTAVKATTAENEVNADKYTFRYCVTALNKDRTEQSVRSAVAACNANIYNNGTTIKISWQAVSGASFYRVYRDVGGIYAYLGETEELSIIDDNIAVDSDYTPPRFDYPFSEAKGIASVTVTNGGSGYSNVDGGVATTSTYFSDTQDSKVGDPLVNIYDEKNMGSGAKGSLVFYRTSRSYSVEDNSGDSTSWTTEWEYTLTITQVTITNPGNGYIKPKAELLIPTNDMYDRLFAQISIKKDEWKKIGKQYYRRKLIDLNRITNAPSIWVTDSTGSGAELKAHVANGKISEITVVTHGSGYTSPTVHISAPVGSGATATATVNASPDYPQCIAYFEQRRVFAATPNNPQAIWMTKTGTESDLSYRIPIRDDDRIAFKIASRERHEIRHIVPLNRLLVLTEAGEWVVASVNSDAITPSSVQLKSQSFIGANMVEPQIVNNSVLYCAARGGHVRELGYNYNAGGYITGDVSLRCAHLFDYYNLLDSSFSRAPYPIAWFVSSSGSLLGLTYVPDQQIGAWHEHTTDGRFESVASVAEDDIDAVYCVVQRTINGQSKRFIERMHDRKVKDISDSFFVDCGGKYEGAETNTVSGLSWLEGCTVNILADGAEMPQQKVTDGKITLSVKAKKVIVGLPIEAKITTLPAIVPMRDGSDAGSKPKNVNSVFLRVYNTSGIYVGPEDGELVEYKQRTTELPGFPPNLLTGGVNVDIKPEWSDTGSITIEQKAPLPLTILSIAADMELGG